MAKDTFDIIGAFLAPDEEKEKKYDFLEKFSLFRNTKWSFVLSLHRILKEVRCFSCAISTFRAPLAHP